MATTSTLSLLAVLLLAAAASSAARPCKTLFFFSATTTFYPHHPIQTHQPHHFTLIFTTSRFDFGPNYPSHEPQLSELPLRFDSSSIRDRTRDIMSVVWALLFGFGCGAVTGAVMYFVWALFSRRSRFELDDFESSDEEDDDVAVAKKLGYVAIPTSFEGVGGDDERKKAVKEVV